MAIDRRRRWLDRFSAWSPVLLLGGLAALTWWLDAQVTDSGGRRDGNTRHDPDLMVEGVRVIELDEAGRAVQTLRAERARHYPDDGTVEFDQPRFVITQPDRPRFTVEAVRARVSGDRENAYFEGRVRATRDGSPERQGASSTDGPSGPITLATEFLHVIPKQDRAQTDRPVTIEEPRGIIQSNGLVLDNESRTLKLNANVRGTLAPPSSN
jgi:lipopolysaccharide export system protein LptC